jgi:hypothetical protein
MLPVIEKDILDYYLHYCELTIWFKKIILRSDPNHSITIQDVTEEFIAERNNILSYMPTERRGILRKELNAIATSYYSKVSGWSKKQKLTHDMV